MPKDYARRVTQKKAQQFYVRRSLLYFLLLLVFLSLSAFMLQGHVQQYLVMRKPIDLKQKSSLVSSKRFASSPKKADNAVKFDFYTLLSKHAPTLETKSKVDSVKLKPYALQVAALKNQASVSKLKKQLSLLGFTVFVVEAPGSRLRYRVNVGPYRNVAQASREQARLGDNNFSSILVRRMKR